MSTEPLRIAAVITTDDEAKRGTFDAAPYFAAIFADADPAADPDDVVRELARQEWGVCAEADAVAYACEDQRAVARVFEYLYCERPKRDGGGIAGFEVEVCPREAMLWLRENRYRLWDELRRVAQPTGTTAGVAVVTAAGALATL